MAKISNTKPAKKIKLKKTKAVAAKVKSAAAASQKNLKSKPAAASPKKKSARSAPGQISKKPVTAAGKAKAAKKSRSKLSPREEKLQNIKMNLLRQRETLLNEAESALNELPGQTIFPDLGDQASAETDRNFMLRLRGREQRLLKKIDEAIDRIDKGVFGICDDCGNEIDIKRLEARPVTTMCIECKTLQEEEEKLRET